MKAYIYTFSINSKIRYDLKFGDTVQLSSGLFLNDGIFLGYVGRGNENGRVLVEGKMREFYKYAIMEKM